MPSPLPVERPHRVTVVAAWIPIALVVLALAACSGDAGGSERVADPDKASDACALVSAESASLAMGHRIGKMADESVDQGGPETNDVSCRYSPDGFGPALWFRARQQREPLSQPPSSGSRRCEPLDIDGVEGFVCAGGDSTGSTLAQAHGTWDDGYVSVSLMISTKHPSEQQMMKGLHAVVRDLHANITPDVYELRWLRR